MNEQTSIVWASQQVSRLKSEMPSGEGVEDEKSPSFFDNLPISQWKVELDYLRESGDMDETERKELQIIREVQRELSQIPYEKGYGTPDQMIVGGKKNCEGASVLGSAVLEEVGVMHRIFISESPTHSPGHVLLLPISSKGQVFWSEMTSTEAPGPIQASSFSSLEGEELTEELSDLLSDDLDRITLLLTDPSLKAKAGNEIWGLVKALSIRVEIFSPDMGRKQIVLDRHATNLVDAGNYAEAERVLSEMMTQGLDSSRTLNNLAWTQGLLAKNSEKAATLELLVQRRPLSLKDWNNLAVTYDTMGDENAAENAYKRGISIKPEAYFLYGKYFKYLISSGRGEDGIKLLNEFIDDQKPQFASPYLDLIQQYVSLGRINDAQSRLEQLRALGLNPSREDKKKLDKLSNSLMIDE